MTAPFLVCPRCEQDATECDCRRTRHGVDNCTHPRGGICGRIQRAPSLDEYDRFGARNAGWTLPVNRTRKSRPRRPRGES
jgi:hypothetical protein